MADYVHADVNPPAAALKTAKANSDAFIGRIQFAW